MSRTFTKIRPRILVQPTQLRIFIKISKIEFPGNQVKIFISWDSASLTESETLFQYQKIATGEKLTPDQRMAKISEWPNSKWMAKFLSFSKQRMAMAIHQIGKIQIGEWPVKTLSLAHPYAY